MLRDTSYYFFVIGIEPDADLIRFQHGVQSLFQRLNRIVIV
ncbi:MAG: hypothetical protein K0Q55_1033 [Verrucomicrobia bacterium]|nr:hypothetical protein [Verrucomicrobiota bacterium]